MENRTITAIRKHKPWRGFHNLYRIRGIQPLAAQMAARKTANKELG
uniref:Uncharacterized protein n=1 Tax=Arundo donax TaxID=35708 RepID=A0A0A9H133_ARUDO